MHNTHMYRHIVHIISKRVPMKPFFGSVFLIAATYRNVHKRTYPYGHVTERRAPQNDLRIPYINEPRETSSQQTSSIYLLRAQRPLITAPLDISLSLTLSFSFLDNMYDIFPVYLRGARNRPLTTIVTKTPRPIRGSNTYRNDSNNNKNTNYKKSRRQSTDRCRCGGTKTHFVVKHIVGFMCA